MNCDEVNDQDVLHTSTTTPDQDKNNAKRKCNSKRMPKPFRLSSINTISIHWHSDTSAQLVDEHVIETAITGIESVVEHKINSKLNETSKGSLLVGHVPYTQLRSSSVLVGQPAIAKLFKS